MYQRSYYASRNHNIVLRDVTYVSGELQYLTFYCGSKSGVHSLCIASSLSFVQPLYIYCCIGVEYLVLVIHKFIQYLVR